MANRRDDRLFCTYARSRHCDFDECIHDGFHALDERLRFEGLRDLSVCANRGRPSFVEGLERARQQ